MLKPTKMKKKVVLTVNIALKCYYERAGEKNVLRIGNKRIWPHLSKLKPWYDWILNKILIQSENQIMENITALVAALSNPKKNTFARKNSAHTHTFLRLHFAAKIFANELRYTCRKEGNKENRWWKQHTGTVAILLTGSILSHLEEKFLHWLLMN